MERKTGMKGVSILEVGNERKISRSSAQIERLTLLSSGRNKVETHQKCLRLRRQEQESF